MPDGTDKLPTREELVATWRSKLMQAQSEYSCAAVKWHAAIEAHRQSLLSSSDANFALTSAAAQAELAARREYLRVLTIFMDLVVKGHVPPEK